MILMFGFKKRTQPAVDPVHEERDRLVLEICRARDCLCTQVRITQAQLQMCYLFPPGSPDDTHTARVLSEERRKLQIRTAEYDLARDNLIQWKKDHPEIRQVDYLESHKVIQNEIRRRG